MNTEGKEKDVSVGEYSRVRGMFIEGWLQCRTVHFRRVNQGRGVMFVLFAQQGLERDSLCQCTARVGEGLSL